MSSNEVRKLLLDIGKELNRSEMDMLVYIQRIVDENWLENLDSLRALTDTQWQQLQLPIRLMQAIRHRLDPPVEAVEYTVLEESNIKEEEAKDLSVVTTALRPLEEPQLDSAEAAKSEESDSVALLTQVELLEVPEETFPQSIITACEDMDCQLSESHIVEVLKTLLKVIDGILATPENPQKRRLRKQNRRFNQYVGQYREALDVLLACGFVESEEDITLPVAHIARLTDCHYFLCDLLSKRGIDVPPLPQTLAFNPYQSRYTFTKTSLRNVHNFLNSEPDRTMEVQQAIKERKHHLQTGGGVQAVDLNPSVFHISSLKSSAMEMSDFTEGFDEQDNGVASGSVTSKELAAIKEAMADTPQFKSRAKKELESLTRQKVHTKCTLRVIFPDQMVLQMSFKPTDTIATVYETIEQFLLEEIRSQKWYIYETPPLRRFTNSNTLYNENLVPCGTVRFSLEDKRAYSSYLKEFTDKNKLSSASSTVKTVAGGF